ncbi:MAG: nucleoside recognition family protein [Denitrovibrio sp.]|nr:MAG: nucleoside recognition family protein [Denitrovibrio sp.]
MEALINIILTSGKTGIDIALYTLLPVMVVMMGFMKLMEAKGVLAFVAKILSPVVRIFGIPGIGIFAALQILLVSFAAPMASLAIMETDGTDRRRVATVFAMVLTMSQANVTFPMATVGLNLPVLFTTSIIGGLFAAALTYYIFAKNLSNDGGIDTFTVTADHSDNAFNTVVKGGQEAVNIVLKSIPLLILAICLVNFLKHINAISMLETILSPALGVFGISGISVLPILTKFLAGGTAMMGVTFDMLKDGIMSVEEFNRIAGFIINPFDLVGIAVLMTVGAKTASIAKPAIIGAILGITLRGILHLIIF